MKITIKDLEIFANHGVMKEENTLGQKFILNIEIDTETVYEDNIEKTVNYAEVCKFSEEFLQNNTYALIEAAALKLSRAVMVKFDKIKKISLEIKKPWAPIKMNVDYVSVKLEAKWHKVYLSIGSNLGDKKKHLLRAVEAIEKSEYCRVLKTSDFIVTKPVGDVIQDDFLNGCLEVETLYEPLELLDFLHTIEDNGGRTHEIHWGPRTIDIDIIYYDDVVLETKQLTIPHKEMSKRYFVLKPLSDIVPYKEHPLLKKTTVELLEKVKE